MIPPPNHFDSLSIKDLLLARDVYHYHLMNKANVVGTAIGRYLIRDSDPWPTDLESDRAPKPLPKKGERNFANSHVRKYSWPCVLVLVDKWLEEARFNVDGQEHPTEMVPKAIDLEDGRSVPGLRSEGRSTGVPVTTMSLRFPQIRWPDHVIGGGYPFW